MLKGMPSPWKGLSVEELKEFKDKYKLANDIEKEAQREKELKMEKVNQAGQTQIDAMKDTLPFLDRG